MTYVFVRARCSERSYSITPVLSHPRSRSTRPNPFGGRYIRLDGHERDVNSPVDGVPVRLVSIAVGVAAGVVAGGPSGGVLGGVLGYFLGESIRSLLLAVGPDPTG